MTLISNSNISDNVFKGTNANRSMDGHLKFTIPLISNEILLLFR